MLEAFEAGTPSFHRGESIDALAGGAGLPARALAASIEGYNYGVETGNDFLVRRPLPLRIGRPPFYAIRHQGTSITSTAGVAVDGELRVVRRNGHAVGNLYAAGEILGSGATQGQAFCGGMMVTPAITFGRLLGQGPSWAEPEQYPRQVGRTIARGPDALVEACPARQDSLSRFELCRGKALQVGKRCRTRRRAARAAHDHPLRAPRCAHQ